MKLPPAIEDRLNLGPFGADKYILIRRGCVQNAPRLDVLDLDVLDGGIGEEAEREVKWLLARALHHHIPEIVEECRRWLDKK